ncbi:hypothetical protein [Aquimarina intermedia]|uniref:Uncharacterized protein n=1 Tax=Aquimarina intermedia TaxID=350814 RepID=A0A5S5BWD7_9FLAO|nr:hypothetical protein [Aquimarina intermedia]TYP71501.1 hypothetical protein BD809_10983 [Aquimarina intermedia]
MEEQNTLHLTLKKRAFEVMVSGEKSTEYRTPSSWIKSRLIDKEGNPKKYDNVKFVNGYGHDKPLFLADYKGFEISNCNQTIKFSNGLTVIVKKGDYIIRLGSVFYKGNQH